MTFQLFWTTLVLWVKKSFLFIKHYGIWILLVLGGVFLFLFTRDKETKINKLVEELQLRNKQHREEVDSLQKIHEQELQRYAEIEKKYNETIERIQKEHQVALESLDKQKKTELYKIIEETKDNPAVQAERINKLFGIEIQP